VKRVKVQAILEKNQVRASKEGNESKLLSIDDKTTKRERRASNTKKKPRQIVTEGSAGSIRNVNAIGRGRREGTEGGAKSPTQRGKRTETPSRTWKAKKCVDSKRGETAVCNSRGKKKVVQKSRRRCGDRQRGGGGERKESLGTYESSIRAYKGGKKLTGAMLGHRKGRGEKKIKKNRKRAA